MHTVAPNPSPLGCNRLLAPPEPNAQPAPITFSRPLDSLHRPSNSTPGPIPTLNIPIQYGRIQIKRNRRNRSCRITSNPRQGSQLLQLARYLPAKLGPYQLRRLVQIPRARVIATPPTGSVQPLMAHLPTPSPAPRLGVGGAAQQPAEGVVGGQHRVVARAARRRSDRCGSADSA